MFSRVSLDNIHQSDLAGDALVTSMFRAYYESNIESLMTLALMNSAVNYHSCSKPWGCKDHGWVSRQMHKLQFTEGDMALVRGGVPFIHMYSFFRDNGANDRGCWWCKKAGEYLAALSNYNRKRTGKDLLTQYNEFETKVKAQMSSFDSNDLKL